MNGQIDFELYSQVHTLKQISDVYSTGEKQGTSVESCLDLIKDKHYNVAVVGEFNRGKSSLINALLGGDILPTDVLPTTAVINRITYGTRQKAHVLYKDGRNEMFTVEEIKDIVTKSTKEKELHALTIDEVIIQYPAIICQNNIDIIDTPGLNEDPQMTKVTLNQLKSIDAAIMVVSALSPFGSVEMDIVRQMVESDEIGDIVFVVSFIDMINEEDRPRILSVIGERIDSITASIESKYSDNAAILKKAKRILSEKKVFGISSRMALESYKTANNKRLEESNFPVFRKELTAILTAGQSVNVVEKINKAIVSTEQLLEQWYKEKHGSIKEKTDMYKNAKVELSQYLSKSRLATDTMLLDIEEGFNNNSDINLFKDSLTSYSISRLSQVTHNTKEELTARIRRNTKTA